MLLMSFVLFHNPQTNSNVKQEPGQGPSNSVADLSAEVERSLLIVEVTSLVKRNAFNNTTNLQNTTVSGMPNFKRFKKVIMHRAKFVPASWKFQDRVICSISPYY